MTAKQTFEHWRKEAMGVFTTPGHNPTAYQTSKAEIYAAWRTRQELQLKWREIADITGRPKESLRRMVLRMKANRWLQFIHQQLLNQ